MFEFVGEEVGDVFIDLCGDGGGVFEGVGFVGKIGEDDVGDFFGVDLDVGCIGVIGGGEDGDVVVVWWIGGFVDIV